MPRLGCGGRDEACIGRINELVEFGDDAPVEQGLHHVALAAPEFSFAGHNAVAQQDFHPIQARTLGVIAVIADQHPLHILRMIDDPGV